LPEPELQKNGNERPKGKRIYDQAIYRKVEERSQHLQTFRDPGKVRDLLFHRQPPPPIPCPLPTCSKINYSGGILKNHLMRRAIERKASDSSIQTQQIQIETEMDTILDSLATIAPESSNNNSPPTVSNEPFLVTDEMQQRALLVSTCIIFLDIETTSGYHYPKGAVCELAAAHEIEDFQIRHTTVNPDPPIKPTISWYNDPAEWSNICVNLHKIRPEHVTHSPKLKDTLQSFLKWVSVNDTIPEVIFVAHNCSFERSRLLPAMKELCPEISQERFKWVDTIPLLKPVILSTDVRGHIVEKCSKLTALIASRLPELDVSGAHSASFDVKALYQLVMKEYDHNWEQAKNIIQAKLKKVIVLLVEKNLYSNLPL
jgi:DNA polymerase III epsilon subunit-like protein